MKKERKRKMFVIIGVLLVLVGMLMIWFNIPYSPVKKQFQNDIEALTVKNHLSVKNEVFTDSDFSHLPIVIQRYIQYCGYIGTPKMSYMKMEYHDVDFMQGRNGPSLKIDYTQYNFVYEPCRMALIDSSMFGIPFEGYDYYQNGIGGMKGVIAKAITLFNQTGTDMDKACLATFLAESLFAPTILLQDYISFEEISDFEVRATISYKGQTASGIFNFNEKYEIVSFTTNDRAATGTDGTIEYVPWSALCSDYQVSESGIKYPTKFQAVWNYSDGDFVYFNGIISKVSYGFEK
ncbi:MAG: DUF6544 family protein [Acutalibacteraceae bacterium]